MATENKISTLSLTLKKRCKRCLHVLREDGTCENPKCKLYVEQEENTDTSNDTDIENKNVLFS